MSIGLILVIILVIFLFGGFSGRFGGYGYGYGHGGMASSASYGHEKSRLSAGITNGRVFRRAEDPNDLVILQDVADVPKARSWFGSDDLKAAMQKSGVIGSPSIH